MPTNHDAHSEADKLHGRSEDQPGYEITDVNVSGVVVFLAGLCGFLLIFFVFCFGMGKVINNALDTSDGAVTKWNQRSSFAGNRSADGKPGKREDLATNPAMQQQALSQMTKEFPSPRLDIDDGNQATADLHAKEDLLLEHYSSVPGAQGGAIRIPIEQAMAAIAQKGLPVVAAGAPTTQLAEDDKPVVQVPLTTGFARTGYELDVMEARAQKMSYGKAEGAEHAELKPAK
jgi:hypothetical protein